jgi:hypothetical protein
MIRKLVTGGVMAATAAAMSTAMLAPAQSAVLAEPICVGATTSGAFTLKFGPHCYPYEDGVNCQEFDAGLSPTLDATAYECIPRP